MTRRPFKSILALLISIYLRLLLTIRRFQSVGLDNKNKEPKKELSNFDFDFDFNSNFESKSHFKCKQIRRMGGMSSIEVERTSNSDICRFLLSMDTLD